MESHIVLSSLFLIFYRREGSWSGLLLETVCRLPTILLEVPFNIINRGEKQVKLELSSVMSADAGGATRAVVLSKDEIVALLKSEKMKDFDIDTLLLKIVYRKGDSIYIVSTCVEQQTFSLFGAVFSSPVPIVWRIDAITGELEVRVSFDTGKFLFENPPRKVESRYE